ncbi:MAG: helix-turn-helix domain-containing protein, partial [Verrucomicrobiae bacterium]|nr:helix-turn-helix domain-containing protein [Verrucomicrobiae bacterium]
RLARGACLLRDHPEMPIKQIADACGFATGQYFATAFKRHFGRSPRRETGLRRIGKL